MSCEKNGPETTCRHVNRFQCQELVFCENNGHCYVTTAVLPFNAISLQTVWIENIQRTHNYVKSFGYESSIIDRMKLPST